MSLHEHATVTSSEVSLVASGVMHVEQWSGLMRALLAGLVEELCPDGLLLGHFKASLSLGAGFIYANTTGEEPLVRLSANLPPEAQRGLLRIALIAYELDPKVVQQALNEVLSIALERWGLGAEVRSTEGECDTALTDSA